MGLVGDVRGWKGETQKDAFRWGARAVLGYTASMLNLHNNESCGIHMVLYLKQGCGVGVGVLPQKKIPYMQYLFSQSYRI